MKTQLLAVAGSLFISSTLFAQKMVHDEDRTTFGVRAGVNFATITGKNSAGDKFDNHIKTGFHAGVNAEVPIASGSYIQPGILYTQKGMEFKNGSDNLKLTYIEIPVNYIYKPTLGTGRMLLGVGPYAAFGLGGKLNAAGTESDVEFTKEYDPSITKFQRKGIDYGANLLAGYELANNLSFQINAQLGLADLNPKNLPGTNSKTKSNNTSFGISAGYRF